MNKVIRKFELRQKVSSGTDVRRLVSSSSTAGCAAASGLLKL